jgi:hypothetical protein
MWKLFVGAAAFLLFISGGIRLQRTAAQDAASAA